MYRGGYLEVEGSWRYDAPQRALIVELNQVQDGPTYRMPVKLGMTIPGEPRPLIERVEINGKQNRLRIPLDQAPTRVTLDPNTWVLMEATFEEHR